MFKALKRGMKKIIPGQSGQSYQNPPATRQTTGHAAKHKPLSSLPSSYLDSDSLFK